MNIHNILFKWIKRHLNHYVYYPTVLLSAIYCDDTRLSVVDVLGNAHTQGTFRVQKGVIKLGLHCLYGGCSFCPGAMGESPNHL